MNGMNTASKLTEVINTAGPRSEFRRGRAAPRHNACRAHPATRDFAPVLIYVAPRRGRNVRDHIADDLIGSGDAYEPVICTASPRQCQDGRLLEGAETGDPLSIGLRHTIGAAPKYSQFCLFEGDNYCGSRGTVRVPMLVRILRTYRLPEILMLAAAPLCVVVSEIYTYW
jgi:hypothetical protein